MLATLQTRNSKPSLSLKAEAEIELRRRRREREAALEAHRVIWRERPDLYARERLGLNVTDEQIQILFSIRDNRRTAVKAHHSLGKTFIAAVAALWWVDCWAAHISYITAPTWGQALGLTFKQAKRLAMLNRLDFDILDSGLIRDRDKFRQTERFLKALNAENGEGFQGEHTAPILIIVEEAVGVHNYIFEASEGLMTDPRCRILEIANPTEEATKFGEHCESPSYAVFSYSALDHPNIQAELHGRPVPFEGAVRLLWLQEMLSVECDDVGYSPDGTVPEGCFEFYTLADIQNAIDGTAVPSVAEKTCYKPTAFFEGRVLGDFPTEASNKVIPPSYLKQLPVIEVNPTHPLQIGCDVARFGDDRTTIFDRIGSVLLSGKELRKFDTVAVADALEARAIALGERFRVNPKSIPINIDVTGGLGAGPYDILKSRGYNVKPVNSSESANDEEQYRNVRSELWFDIRDRAKARNIDISRLDPDMRRKLQKELSTPFYKVQAGKKVVEDKSETKKRLGSSPDLADGFNLCFYESKEHQFATSTFRM